jgi:hypothetical protein
MENYSLDNIHNWKNLYTNWMCRWKELRSDKLENNTWKKCIICDNLILPPSPFRIPFGFLDKQAQSMFGNGGRFCSNDCYHKYSKLRESYRAKARNLLKLKTDKACKFTGTNKTTLTEHIECLFIGEMNWRNYGTVWQIDHIVPMAWFDLTNEEEIKCCCNYKNLQPLLIKDNYDKNASIY